MNDPAPVERPGPASWILALAVVLAMAGVFGDAPADEAEATPVHARLTPASPVRLVVPTLDLRAPVVPVEVNSDGVLHPPEDVDVVGWWRRSAKPGATAGQTLLTGHTVEDGRGVLDRLGELRRGDLVRVRTHEGTMRYAVSGKAVYSRQQLRRRAPRLFGQGRDEPRLVLITCTNWDGVVYRSNIVVFARPAESRGVPVTRRRL